MNCNIACQDDACALFGSNKFVTITNCSFSARWSVFRFGGGQSENIAVSNCLIYDTFGCLIFRNVTGPISIGLDSTRRNNNAPPAKAYARNVQFHGIQAAVASEGQQYADMSFRPNYGPARFAPASC